MKRFLSTILALIVICTCIPTFVFAEKSEFISGSNAMITSPDADKLVIGTQEYELIEDIQFTAVINVTDASSEYNEIQLNGKKIASLKDGENRVELSTSQLLDGENEIVIVLGSSAGKYTDSTVYGSVNADDITVNSVRFEGYNVEKPEGINKYMPIENEAGFNVVSADYADSIDIGDGWYADTGLGGNALYEPVLIGYVFEKTDSSGIFSVDTTVFEDGEYGAEFYKNGKVIETAKYVIDNTAPDVTFSVSNGANVTRFDEITYTINDTTKVKSELYVDSKKASSIDLSKLNEGSHIAWVKATDELGNIGSEMLVFNVSDVKYTISVSDVVKTDTSYEGKVYSAEILTDIRMFENRLGEYDQDYLRCDNEVLISFNDKAEHTTSAIGESVPYQSFVVNTDDADGDTVIVSYTGATGNGSDIKLMAWNYKDSCWDKIAVTPSGTPVSVEVDLATYSFKDKMRVNATPNIVYNGSNSILWSSDTQFYSRFENLNDVYYKINEYAVDLYNNGEIGYYVHTGDLVDQVYVSDEVTHKEFSVASKAQSILDDANVPNGVVVGNHDINHETANYEYYYQYFGEERYTDFDWYGGSLNNNMHHYDLISIGAYDFVFMYLGCYKEVDDDTVAWAKAVCDAYPTRNVVICTHEYLLPSGQYSDERCEELWNRIIVPNENVVMILCGHNDGVCNQMHQVGDSDRYVLEVLADYQFAELGIEPINKIGDIYCDGEGFIRLMTFTEAGQVVSQTYSPTADIYNYYPSYMDTFVYDLEMIEADRSIKTTDFDVVHSAELLGDASDEVKVGRSDAVFVEITDGDDVQISKVYILDEYKSRYFVDPEREYNLPEPEKIYISGFENVDENFVMNSENAFPDESYIDVGLNLLPEKISQLYKTSGTSLYNLSQTESGGVTISHRADTNTWITVANNVRKKIDVSEYDRLYFAVTAAETTKWNIYVNFSNKQFNFSQNEDIASMFGYVNALPSDITGTWSGYIDLSEYLEGDQYIDSIYLVAATPTQDVTFDYLFIGKSNGGKVRFVTDENIITAKDGPLGSDVELLDTPFKRGYTFDGWYTEAGGGEKVEDKITLGEEVVTLYARFTKKADAENNVVTYDKEINLERIPIGKIIIMCICIIFILCAVIVLKKKINTSKKQTENA